MSLRDISGVLQSLTNLEKVKITEEEAIKLAEQDIKNLHPSFKIDISGVRDDDN